MPPTTPQPTTHWLAPVALAACCWLAAWASGPAHAADTEPPVDVPITRGKIDLGSIRPSLGPIAKPTSPEAASGAANATTTAPVAAPAAVPVAAPTTPAVAAPNTGPTSVTSLGETVNNPPRTVADFAALARAKAAADAASKPGQTATTPTTATPTAPTPAVAPPTTATKPATMAPEPPAAHADHGAQRVPDSAAVMPAASAPPPPPAQAAPAKTPAPRTPERASAPVVDNGMQTLAEKIIAAMARAEDKQKTNAKTVKTTEKKDRSAAQAAPAADTTQVSAPTSSASRDYIRARAAELSGRDQAEAIDEHEVFLGNGHWGYEGHTGPDNWAKLNPEFSQCARGKRQSPIAIDSGTTLQGPAEAIDFNYETVAGSVLNNGHTIQVDLAPGNFLTVRGTRFELAQFHFHHPAEEKINGKTHPMVAHLVHRSAEGELAVLAVQLTAGGANPVVGTVWTHMPLDKNDRVPLPSPGLNPMGLLPADQRYFQYMGSLTTPPCSEGVLWLVLKTPVTLSQAQLTLFGQLFPSNVRPVQPSNDRPVREGM